jgi:hypothetical protein
VSSISRMLFEDEYSIKQPIVFEYQNSPFWIIIIVSPTQLARISPCSKSTLIKVKR